MIRRLVLRSLLLAAVLSPVCSNAAEGGGSFCLFELPEDGSGRLRYINLTIVQFVELSKDELKIVYGGGALGSGYEAKVPLKSLDEGKALLEHLRKTAAECRR